LTPRVVIDTNVVVFALLLGGTPGALIPLWKDKLIQPFVSKDIIQEYLRVFAYPKFELTENEISYLLSLEKIANIQIVTPAQFLELSATSRGPRV